MFFTQFGLLFSNMQWFVAAGLIIGAVLIIIEGIQPGFGFFGITGISVMVLSIILRAVFHKPEDNVGLQVFQLVLLNAILGAIIIVMLIIAHKKGWIAKSPFYLKETAVDKISDGTKNYLFLRGKYGIALTALHPSGKAEIEGKSYDVESSDVFIDTGADIEVVDVQGGIIKVKAKKPD